MSIRSDRIVAMVLEYGRAFSEALMHQSASKADISQAETLKWIRRIRTEVDALDALAEGKVMPAAQRLQAPQGGEQ